MWRECNAPTGVGGVGVGGLGQLIAGILTVTPLVIHQLTLAIHLHTYIYVLI